MKKLIGTIAGAIALTFSFSAFADSVDIEVKRNHTNYIDFFMMFNVDTCEYLALPRAKVSKKPEHGEITFKKHRETLRGAGSKKCDGAVVPGLLAIYKPDRNFKGEDQIRVNYTTHHPWGTEYKSRTYNITVK